MLQIFKYNNNNVTFRNEDNVIYVNATEMAKDFNKKPVEWLRNNQTSAFVEELSKVRNITLEKLIITQQGGVNPGTWFHKDVALDFAQFH